MKRTAGRSRTTGEGDGVARQMGHTLDKDKEDFNDGAASEHDASNPVVGVRTRRGNGRQTKLDLIVDGR